MRNNAGPMIAMPDCAVWLSNHEMNAMLAYWHDYASNRRTLFMPER